MVIIMESGTPESSVQAVVEHLSRHGFDIHRSSGLERTVLGAIGVKPGFDTRQIEVLPGVAAVYRVTEPYKFASRASKADNTVVDVAGVRIGGEETVVIAGPCAVEDEARLDQTAAEAADRGASILRAGVCGSKFSPDRFAGPGQARLTLMRTVADRHRLAMLTQVLEPAHVKQVSQVADMLEVEAGNMQNFPLLRELGRAGKPVLLTRGRSATIEEWLMSAEALIVAGNPDVVLCESGIRTFEPHTRSTLDLSAVPVIKAKSHLPVLVDPCHGTGIRNKVIPMARASIAAGADGLLIDVHPDPQHAPCDGPQSLPFEQFGILMDQVRQIAAAIGRSLGSVRPLQGEE